MNLRAALAVTILAAAPAAAAEYEDFFLPRRGFVQYDALLGGAPFDSSKRDLLAFFPAATSSSEKIQASPGAVRVGVLTGPFKTFFGGASIGYVGGPKSSLTINDPGGAVQVKQEVTFFRFLLEAQDVLPLTDRWDVRLRAGVGYARGRMRVGYAGPGFAFAGTQAWGGFTWEAGPALAWSGEHWALEIGALLTELPSKSPDYTPIGAAGSLYVPRFSWAPWALEATLHFDLNREKEG